VVYQYELVVAAEGDEVIAVLVLHLNVSRPIHDPSGNFKNAPSANY
jgi:hypothetical protein